MSNPPRICSCGEKVPHGELCICQRTSARKRNARHDARRPSARERGYNHEWRKARTEYLTMHPYCAMPGCGKPASVVDHILAHRGDRNLFWSRTNWQPLCAPCHNSIKQRQERNQ
ncbi:HNH endonuclease signature motif containing protein [Rhizobium sp. PL01]|uniref:HNH endonuclease signature motif containing protein n=1 Tax=Rhizobium sp. PL01 TaxID=3085631 RepID=UPI0029825A5F|nr:HNH endonuclease signature motif containing protein [Rhizobium sp. PL01]MDW5314084.1 HNH endonuclease signature motif containing protein [Rhizobium sp. PL01]